VFDSDVAYTLRSAVYKATELNWTELRVQFSSVQFSSVALCTPIGVIYSLRFIIKLLLFKLLKITFTRGRAGSQVQGPSS